MKDLSREEKIELANKLVRRTRGLLLIFAAMVVLLFLIPMLPEQDTETASTEVIEENEAELDFSEGSVVDGIHQPSGMIADKGYEMVVTTCGACHSLKLVKQNRATREGWEDMIRWMQETQKLWDLGANEAVILDYLAKNYAPEKKGRRQKLAVEEWYELEG